MPNGPSSMMAQRPMQPQMPMGGSLASNFAGGGPPAPPGQPQLGSFSTNPDGSIGSYIPPSPQGSVTPPQPPTSPPTHGNASPFSAAFKGFNPYMLLIQQAIQDSQQPTKIGGSGSGTSGGYSVGGGGLF